MSPDGQQVQEIRRRRFPIVGNGQGRTSFIHVDDAAEATALAIEARAPSPVYNIADDEPAPFAEWLPYLAPLLGAKSPLHMPAWLARPGGREGRGGVVDARPGASSAKAKRELGWQPRFASWRDG